MTREALAALALRTLDAQRKYFNTRSREKLIAARQLEAELRHACNAIANESQQSFFSPEVATGTN